MTRLEPTEYGRLACKALGKIAHWKAKRIVEEKHPDASELEKRMYTAAASIGLMMAGVEAESEDQ